MAHIIDISNYINRTQTPTEKAKAKLREILSPMGTWETNEEKIRHYMDLAEQDRKEWVG